MKNSLWVHEFIKFISLQVNEFVSLSQIGRRKEYFHFAKGKNEHAQIVNQQVVFQP
jgi:hypothetical protein